MAVQTKYIRLANGVTLPWTERLAARPDAVGIDSVDAVVEQDKFRLRTLVTQPEYEFLKQPGLKAALAAALRKKKLPVSEQATVKEVWELFQATNRYVTPEDGLENLQGPAPSDSVLDAMESREELQACAKANFGLSFPDDFDIKAIRAELRKRLKA